jgi:hypothetical protein
VAVQAENEWRAGNPKVGPPERELFLKKLRRPKSERKWKLVPVVTFCS